jgi:hypothetical protein
MAAAYSAAVPIGALLAALSSHMCWACCLAADSTWPTVACRKGTA